PPGADATTFEKIAVGIVGGSLSAAQAISNIVKAKHKTDMAVGTSDIAADAVTITNAGTQNVISSSLAQLWSVDGSKSDQSALEHFSSTKPDLSSADNSSPGLGAGSSVSIAIIMGVGGDQGIFRVELRSDKSVAVKVGIDNVGISVSANRSKRLAAFGYDEDSWKGEILGNRIGQNN
ncbi:MAG: hypothetical protein AAFX99_19935, partial [Myxococcota bacterium]